VSSVLTAHAETDVSKPTLEREISDASGEMICAAAVPRREAERQVRDSKIMIVDDESYTILVIRKYLEKAGFANFVTTSRSVEAMELIALEQPDVILLDIKMPEVTGLDILESLSVEPKLQRIPVLVLTAATDEETEASALELGATDLLPKPVKVNSLIPRVRNSLLAKAYQDRLANHAVQLDQQVRQRTAELAKSREEVLHCLARASEYRDDDTGFHVARVGRYAGVIARELGFQESRIEQLQLAAQLHDVGKIGIPDAILQKPGKLDPDEYERMQRHCAIAKKIIRPMPEDEWGTLRTHTRIGSSLMQIRSSPLMIMASRIAQSHHEKWDGSGYPLGLAGEDIPIEARITAVADVYDALSSKRPYKPAFPRERCFEIMKADRGTHFDPTVLDAFFMRIEDIVGIQLEYMDIA
jgi:putative two-component system response regulator